MKLAHNKVCHALPVGFDAGDGVNYFVCYALPVGFDAGDGVNYFVCYALQVGFDAGDGVNYFALPASRTSEIVNITSMYNVDANLTGLFMFRVDSAEIKQGGCSTNGKFSQINTSLKVSMILL